MDELKPCPFCDGEAEYNACQTDYPPQNCQVYVRCRNCKAEINADGKISDINKLKKKVVKLWNRRAAPENKPLTCEKCVHHNLDAPWPEICFDCKRQSRQDMYRRKPEGK